MNPLCNYDWDHLHSPATMSPLNGLHFIPTADLLINMAMEKTKKPQ